MRRCQPSSIVDEMEASASGPGAFPPSVPVLAEGISLVLSRWTTLQLAVKEQWGGSDSARKSQEFADSLISWFRDSKELYIDDLEAMLDETMIQTFNAVMEDGSIEEVAEQLMIIHEECLLGKYDLIVKLRQTNSSGSAISQSIQVIDKNVENDSDEEMSDANHAITDVVVQQEEHATKHRSQSLPDEDGWSVVSRKNRGKRSQVKPML